MNTLTVTLSGREVAGEEVARKLTENGFTVVGEDATITVEGPDGVQGLVNVEGIGAGLSHGRRDTENGRPLSPGSLALA